MELYEAYKRLSCLGERLDFVDMLGGFPDSFWTEQRAIELITLLEIENDEIIAHDIAFLAGRLEKKGSFRASGSVISRLIRVFDHTKSVVLRHEILESLGCFTHESAIRFLERYRQADCADLALTSEHSLNRISRRNSEGTSSDKLEQIKELITSSSHSDPFD